MDIKVVRSPRPIELRAARGVISPLGLPEQRPFPGDRAARWLLPLLAAASVASGCASHRAPRAPQQSWLRASPIFEHAPPPSIEPSEVADGDELASTPAEILEASEPEAKLPPASKPVPAPPPPAPLPPGALIARANDMASQAPEEASFVNAVTTYAYEPGGLYKVFAAPWYVTDIALEPGEELLGPVAGGDPTRWRLDVGAGAVGGVAQKHVFVKPLRPGLKTNLILTTNRRVYLLDLQSLEETAMLSVCWTYPQDAADAPFEGVGVRTSAPAAPTSTPLENLNFDYAIEVVSGKPAWKPQAVYDDGEKTFVRFDRRLLTGEAPALYVVERGEMQLVNYRVRDTLYIVDRLFDVAELRLGNEDQDVVRLRNRRRAAGSAPPRRSPSPAPRRPGTPL